MVRRDFLLTASLSRLAARDRGKPPARSCILLRLTGGASQLDTWDPKPDAPSSVRGPFRPIKTNVDGIQISEIFPLMAQRADQYALVRSLHSTGSATHEDGLARMSAGLPAAPTVENCLQARRLVEAGAPFVTVDLFGSVHGGVTWDSHGFRPFSTIADYRDHVGPRFDRAFTTLLDDLDERGLLETTIVVAVGEFGRSPKINIAGGRDHWPECQTAILAGGPIRGGQVIGSSDAIGAAPKDRPVTPAEFVSTIHHGLGLAVDPAARPIHELFA